MCYGDRNILTTSADAFHSNEKEQNKTKETNVIQNSLIVRARGPALERHPLLNGLVSLLVRLPLFVFLPT